jgi:hypothetical protein
MICESYLLDTLTGGSHVIKMSKQIDFTLHKRVDNWDMMNPSFSARQRELL